MRKPVSKILVLLMALVLMVSLLPATALATETALEVNWNLTLCDRISANFYVGLEEADVANTVVTFSLDGQTLTVNASQAAKKDGYYVFTVGLAAAQMTDEFDMAVVTNGSVVFSGTYSIRKYADVILKNENGYFTEKDQAIVVAMLNYGAAAQTYFGHNTNNLAITGYESQVVTNTMPTSTDGMETGSMTGVSLHGRSLLFKSRTTVRFYFNVEGDINSYTFTDGKGKTYTPGNNGKYYVVDVTDINPQNLADIVTMTVSKGDESMTVSYSPLHYMVRKNNDANPALKGLVQSMYDYHSEALEYLTYQAGSLTLDTTNGTNGLGYKDSGAINMVYFNHGNADALNSAYNSNWSVEYKPLSADAIKLVRGGATYNVGIPSSGTVVKIGQNAYGLKLEPWTVSGNLLPLQDQDCLIVEGSFRHDASKNTLVIAKTYIYYDGSAWVCAPTYTANAGNLQTNANGAYGEGVYVSMDANNAPVDVEYAPVAAENYQVIRSDGTVENIGKPGRGTLVKYADNYFLKCFNDPWCIDYVSITTDDVLVVSGLWQCNANTDIYLNISKTYVYYDGSAWVCAPTYTMDVGNLQTNSGAYGEGIFVNMAVNRAPTELEYAPVAAENYQVMRSDGTVENIGQPGRGTLVKYADSYFLKCFNDPWCIDYVSITTDDVLIVSGLWQCNDQAQKEIYLNITKTYVYYDGSAWICSPTYDINAGSLQTNANGAYGEGIYVNMDANRAPANVEYAPVAAENYQVIRKDGTVENIGKPGRGTLVKYADKYFLKCFNDPWCIDYASITTDDILVVSGLWQCNDNTDIRLNITKTYVYYDGSAWVCSTTKPIFPIEAGPLLSTDGTATEGVFVTMAANDAPVNVEYTPVAAENYQVIRKDGTVENIGQPGRGTLVKYDSKYFLKFLNKPWCIAGVEVTTEDVVVVSGLWQCNDGVNTDVYLNITKSYVYFDGSAWVCSTTKPVSAINAGPLLTDAGANGGEGVYVNMAANDAPVNVEYTPVAGENFQVIRKDGTVENIGQPGRGTLVKYQNNYYLKFLNKPWCIAGVEVTTEDIVVVSGQWQCNDGVNTDVYLNISKSYVYFDGTAWVCSTTEPILGIQAGPLLSTDGTATEGVFVTMAANDAPVNVEYTPVAAENYQVIRKDGTVENIGQPGRGTLVKYDSKYFLKFLNKPWCIAGVEVTTDDIVVVSGLWQCNDGVNTDVYLNITKSYVYFNGTSWVVSQTLPTIVNGGVMQVHEEEGLVDPSGEIVFALTENSLPVDEGMEVEYTANAGVIKLSRAGKTYDVTGTVIKYSSTAYYMVLDSNALPMEDQDYLIVEGAFVNEDNGYTLNIDKSYIFMDGEDFIFTTTEPEIGFLVTNLNLSGNPEPQDNGGVQFYVSHDAHGATVNSDWSAEYTPISADAIKLVRGGETFSVGNPGQGTLVALNPTSSYFKFVPWTFTGNKLPLQEGDKVIIDGLFQHKSGTDIMNIEYTEIVVGADGALTFPNAEIVYNIGTLGNHDAGKASDGFYATSASSNAPFNSDWSLMYKPVSADCVKFYDASEKTTTSVANAGGEMLVKFSETEYYFKSWTLGDSFGKLALDDYYIIEGRFYNEANNCYIQIEKTYVVYDGTSFTFSATKPVSGYPVTNLTNHSNGWTTGGIYISHDAHGATYNSDWSVEYAPISAGAIKLVRGGETYSVGTSSGTLVVYSQTAMFLKTEAWTISGNKLPLVGGDKLIIEGKFQHTAGTDIINIEKTEIVVNENGTLSFIGEGDKYIDGGLAYAHSDGWNPDEVVFFMNKNGLPVDSTSATRYNPTSTATIKKIRNGVTTDVGNTGAETIYKNYEERYAIAAWAVGYLQAGDVLIIEGDFVNTSNGYTLHIDKSYLTLNADGTVTATRVEDTGSGEIQLPIVPAAMTIGVWNGSHHYFDDATMDKLVNAGITRIIGIRPQYVGNGNDGVRALLDRAQAHGISIVFDMRNKTQTRTYKMSWYGSSITRSYEYWDGSLKLIDSFTLDESILTHPALEGLSAFDEPWAGDEERAEIVAARAAFDTLKTNAGRDDLIFFMNLLPENSADDKFVTSENANGFWTSLGTDYLDNYVNPLLTAGSITDHVAWDDYTLIHHTDSTYTGIRPDYFHGFEDMTKTGKPMWYTMLSAGHSFSGQKYYYTTPTQGELRWQMAVAMAFGVQNINHYIFATTDPLYDCMATIDSNGNITGWADGENGLFTNITQVGQEYKAWDEIFMAYDHVGTKAVSVSGMMALEKSVDLSSHGISSVSSSTGGVLVGVFENSGDKAFMITNAGTVDSGTAVHDGYKFTMGETNVTLTFTDCSQVAVIDQGEIKVMTVTNNTVQIPVGAYEGVFVIPVA